MKVLPILLLLLMVLPLVPAVSASDWSYSSTTSFASYFHVWAISGSVSSATPTLTFDTAKEYYEFTLTLTPASSNCTIEFTVSDGYMGCDLYVSSVLKTGDAAYTLSVPYAYNSTDVPAKDWGSGTLASPTGNMGIYKRVMLYQNGANPVTVVFRVYYATAPAVGFDGVNDYVLGSHAVVSDSNFTFNAFLKSHRTVASNDRHFVIFNSAYTVALYSMALNNYKPTMIVRNDTNTLQAQATSNTVLASSAVRNITDVWDGSYAYQYDNGVMVKSSIIVYADSVFTPAKYSIGNAYNQLISTAVWYNLTVSDNLSIGSDLFLINASSFSGGASTTVDDFSASDNDGTAYGNVQYKAYTGTGFQFTIPGSVFLTVEWGSYPPAGTSSPAVGSTTELAWGGSQTLYAYPMSNYAFDCFNVSGVEYPNATSLTLYTNCTVYLNLESVDNVALAGFYTEILSFWVPFVAFAILSFWSIRMRGNYKYFGLVFPILGLTWAFAETSYPSALFYYVSATFFIFMLLFVGFKLAGLGNRNQRKWG